MAFPSSSSATAFLLAVLLFTFTTLIPSTTAALVRVDGLQVHGLLVCSATGNLTPGCADCHGIAGVNVTITCNGATATVGHAITDSSGFFNSLLTIVDGLLFDVSSVPCVVSVKLPVANCALLAGTGELRAPVTLLGTIISGILGLVAQVTCGAFTLVPV